MKKLILLVSLTTVGFSATAQTVSPTTPKGGSQYDPSSRPTEPTRRNQNDPGTGGRQGGQPGVYNGNGYGKEVDANQRLADDVNSGRKTVREAQKQRSAGSGATPARP